MRRAEKRSDNWICVDNAELFPFNLIGFSLGSNVHRKIGNRQSKVNPGSNFVAAGIWSHLVPTNTYTIGSTRRLKCERQHDNLGPSGLSEQIIIYRNSACIHQSTGHYACSCHLQLFATWHASTVVHMLCKCRNILFPFDIWWKFSSFRSNRAHVFFLVGYLADAPANIMVANEWWHSNWHIPLPNRFLRTRHPHRSPLYIPWASNKSECAYAIANELRDIQYILYRLRERWQLSDDQCMTIVSRTLRAY